MALINCPECNREISDKSDKCIHCGYPLQTNTVSQDEKYSIRVLHNKDVVKVKTIRLIREYTSLGLKEAKDLYDSAPVTIAKNLSKDEVTRMAQPFYDNLIKVEIIKSDGTVNNLGLKPQPPKNKYYSNEPLKSYTSNSTNIKKPHCPTCNSTNIQKISLTQKAVGGAMFGLFSSKIRNTFKCKGCGYKW